MTKTNIILLSVFIFIIVILIVIKSIKSRGTKVSSENSKNKSSTQENDGGNVKITVTPKTLTVGEKPSFDVVFETHSVDLTFDVAQISSLVDDKGKIFNQSVWEGSEPGGHHREGILTFNTVLSETKFVELIIRNMVGVAERKFKWNR